VAARGHRRRRQLCQCGKDILAREQVLLGHRLDRAGPVGPRFGRERLSVATGSVRTHLIGHSLAHALAVEEVRAVSEMARFLVDEDLPQSFAP
jgi:hypothetical protein